VDVLSYCSGGHSVERIHSLATKNTPVTECDFISRMLLKMSIEIMLVTLLPYVFTLLFFRLYHLLCAVILHTFSKL